jgi:hypothetical protein
LVLSWGRTSRDTRTIQFAVNLPADPINSGRQLVTIGPANSSVPLFVTALGTKNTTVVVDNNVMLDLSGLPPITQARVLIRDGVQLIGGRTAIPGRPFQAGPLFYTNDHPDILFEVQGDNVSITGVRIQGPNMGESSDYLDTGLLISDVKTSCGPQNPADGSWPPCPPTPGHINVQVDHNEFSGWSHAAVWVTDRAQRISVPSFIDHRSSPAEVEYTDATEPVWIHDNFIHHNQHLHGNGYGVAVDYGAHALIERNVFDYNRHAITEENGQDDSQRLGYRAYRNLVLPNGGVNDAVEFAPDRYTQQFDIHGSNALGFCVGLIPVPGTPTACAILADHMYGPAGHDYDIRYNSFLYNNGPAIKLRGTPEPGLPWSTVVRFNVFAHEFPFDTVVPSANSSLGALVIGGAVEWTENPPVVQDNLTGRTTYQPNTTCDFDGDGINDTFIATEQTLWYCPGQSDCATAAGSGKPTWVYLNMSTKSLNLLALGHFSGGAVCDVVDSGWISVGGAGPWIPLTPLTSPSGVRGTLPASGGAAMP